ncbi:MAG TPA: redox-sensing transcriptional repressor Rex [Bacillota bacterium]
MTNIKYDKIPLVVIKRLPLYQRVLSELAAKGVGRISSQELAATMKITASQLRQDLSFFGSFGQQGYGYRVEQLLDEVNRILGLNYGTDMVMVGAGYLGKALLNYENFRKRGFVIQAVFDIDPELIGKTLNGITVRPSSQLATYLEQNPTEIGIICTPAAAAQNVADIMVQSGIKGIWNFAPVTLKVPETTYVEHVHISESLMVLSFKIRQAYRNG